MKHEHRRAVRDGPSGWVAIVGALADLQETSTDESPSDIRHDVATVLTEALDGRGRGTKAALARTLSVNESTIFRWTQGLSMPSAEFWPAMEEFLEIPRGTLADLIGETTARPSNRDRYASKADFRSNEERIAVLQSQLTGVLERLAEMQGQVNDMTAVIVGLLADRERTDSGA